MTRGCLDSEIMTSYIKIIEVVDYCLYDLIYVTKLCTDACISIRNSFFVLTILKLSDNYSKSLKLQRIKTKTPISPGIKPKTRTHITMHQILIIKKRQSSEMSQTLSR